MNGFYRFAMHVMRFIMPLWYKLETEGLENVPKESGYLFISNHRSMADPILIGVQNPQTQFCFLAKQELFSDGLVGWVLRKLGAIAIDRGSGDVTALEEIEFRLQNGENALIFPEGTRSKDGKLGRFKTGAAYIAAQTGVPIVPVAISFDDELHFRSTIHVRYGAPFQIPQTDPKNPSAAVLKQIRQEMTKNVSALLPLHTEEKPKLIASAPEQKDNVQVSQKDKKESEDTENTMSKNKNKKKAQPDATVQDAMDMNETITEISEETVSELDEFMETAETATESEDMFSEFDSDEQDEDDTESRSVLPFKIHNPFKKTKKAEPEESFAGFDEEGEQVASEEDFLADFDEEAAETESVEEVDGAETTSSAGFSFRNPFRKKASADIESDAENGEAVDDEDDEDEDEYGHHIDYGKIALILTFVILGIFAVDFCRRLWNDWRGNPGSMNIYNNASSIVESMSNDSSEPETSELPDVSTDYYIPIYTQTDATSSASDLTTTTTTVTVENRQTETRPVAVEEQNKGSLVMVNSTHQQAYTPDLVAFADVPYQHLRLKSTYMQFDRSISEPLVKWINDFHAATGLENLMVYETNNTPAAAVSALVPYGVVIPERTTGLTLDFSILNAAAGTHSPYMPDGNYAWLAEHAADYGFITRYPADKAELTGMAGMTWHFRYVGAPHATYMKENNLCLEEYLERIQRYTWGSEHLTTTVGGVEYEMYYVPAAEDSATTNIPYPVGVEPMISGDNIDGFIVCCPKQ